MSNSASVPRCTDSAGSARVPHDPRPASRWAVPGQDAERLRQLPVAAPAARVVERDDEVAVGRGADPALDRVPGVCRSDREMTAWSCPSGAPSSAAAARFGGDAGDRRRRRCRRRRTPAPARPSRTPRRRRSRSARRRARRGPPRQQPGRAPPRRRARSPATRVPGRSRSATCATYWSRPTTTDARRSSSVAPRGEQVARAGPEADEGEPAARAKPGHRDRGVGRLLLADHENAASASADASATLGVPTAASARRRWGSARPPRPAVRPGSVTTCQPRRAATSTMPGSPAFASTVARWRTDSGLTARPRPAPRRPAGRSRRRVRPGSPRPRRRATGGRSTAVRRRGRRAGR